LTVNRSFRNEKPTAKTNPVALMKTCYADLFARIGTETDPAERDRLIREVKKLAKKAKISIPRRMFSGG
jgi:hypothetical protein